MNSRKVAWMIVHASKTVPLPNGDSTLAYKKLREKYAPVTAPSYIRLQRQFRNTEFKRGTDPDIFIVQLETIRIMMNDCKIVGKTDIKPMDVVIEAVAKLDSDYDIVVHQIEHDIENDLISITLEALKTELRSRYAHLKDQWKKLDVADEHALSTVMGYDEEAWVAFLKQFKGSCNACRKYGHKIVDCPDRKPAAHSTSGNKAAGSNVGGSENGGSRIKGKCDHCGIYGHMKQDCRKRIAEMASGALGEKVDHGGAMSEDISSFDELGFIAEDGLDFGADDMWMPDYSVTSAARKREIGCLVDEMGTHNFNYPAKRVRFNSRVEAKQDFFPDHETDGATGATMDNHESPRLAYDPDMPSIFSSHDLKRCDSDVEYHYESESDDNEVALAAETLETPPNTSDDEKGMSCMLEGNLYSPFTKQT